ncbi:hypothetical protein ES288_D04G160500v1 [Gossypium darwinii]|uniref:SGNH hydrolase-type esterase domain-containing protein n=1 Tax=Gossypium darwinii TaxID=34276 RepID=A0A5D2CXY6_GOSDA|nr:hypothetical protein ES288_D04G160500v1 [Gossypium darwinii]
MIGPGRPLFVLFGSSVVQLSYSHEGWGAILAHAYARKADIILRGYGGWNSRRALEVLDKVFPKDAAVQPSLVIVYFGGNDSTEPHPSGLGPHVPLPEYVENMKKIAMHLKLSTAFNWICHLVWFWMGITSGFTVISDLNHFVFRSFKFIWVGFFRIARSSHISGLGTPPVNEGQILESFGKCGRTNEGCRIYSEACLKLCQEVDIKCIDLWTAIQQRDDWKTVCFTDGIHLSSEGSKLVGEEILKALAEEPSLCWRSLPTEFDEDSVFDPVDEEGKNINISNL